jgi:hypothetical protein
VTTSWRIEPLDAGCYRFVNVSGHVADNIFIIIEDPQHEEIIAIAGPIDYVLGLEPYSFDHHLTEGDYRICWEPVHGDPGTGQSVSFTLPVRGAATTLFET